MAKKARTKKKAEEEKPKETKPKNRGGRPPKYRPEFCEMIIEHMKDGSSFCSFAAKVEAADRTINAWRERYPEFNQACQVAEKNSISFWESKALEVALGEYVQYTADGRQIGKRPHAGMIQFIMKQRFHHLYNKAPSQEIKIEGGDKGMEFKLNYDPKGLSDD